MGYLKLSDISEHLTKNILDTIFKSETKSQDNVVKTEVVRASPIGEGLLSAVYRIYVTGEKFNTVYVAKALVRDAVLRKTLNCEMFFQREVDFFSKVLPVLNELQKSLHATQSLQNHIAKCYYSYCDGKNDFIILEDLSESGHYLLPQAPNEIQREGTLKFIAHLHAVSMSLRVKNPEVFYKLANEYPEIYFQENRKAWYSKWQQKAIDIDTKVIEDFRERMDKVYYEKYIKVIQRNVYEQIMEITSTWGDNTVICHGDCWYSNFMSSNEKVVAIDFQLFRFASPATDLAFFLLSCINITTEIFKTSVDLYYSYLSFFMEDMHIDIDNVFPRNALNAEMKKFGKFGFFCALTTIPLMISEKCDTLKSFNEHLNENGVIPLESLWVLTPFETEEQKMRIINALRVSVDIGLL